MLVRSNNTIAATHARSRRFESTRSCRSTARTQVYQTTFKHSALPGNPGRTRYRLRDYFLDVDGHEMLQARVLLCRSNSRPGRSEQAGGQISALGCPAMIRAGAAPGERRCTGFFFESGLSATGETSDKSVFHNCTVSR